jgi:hypothetical protein
MITGSMRLRLRGAILRTACGSAALLGCVAGCATPSKVAGNLDSLYAANAFHEALDELCAEHDLDLCYAGALARMHRRGLRPLNEPATWEVATPAVVDSAGVLVEAGRVLFDMKMQSERHGDQDVAVTYGGRTYYIRVVDVAYDTPADREIEGLEVSPLQLLRSLRPLDVE